MSSKLETKELKTLTWVQLKSNSAKPSKKLADLRITHHHRNTSKQSTLTCTSLSKNSSQNQEEVQWRYLLYLSTLEDPRRLAICKNLLNLELPSYWFKNPTKPMTVSPNSYPLILDWFYWKKHALSCHSRDLPTLTLSHLLRFYEYANELYSFVYMCSEAWARTRNSLESWKLR